MWVQQIVKCENYTFWELEIMTISYYNRQNYLHIQSFIILKTWWKEELVGWEKVRVLYIECDNMTKWQSPFQSTSDKLSGRMQDCEIVRVREHDIVTVSKYVIRCTCYKVSTSLENLTILFIPTRWSKIKYIYHLFGLFKYKYPYFLDSAIW